MLKKSVFFALPFLLAAVFPVFSQDGSFDFDVRGSSAAVTGYFDRNVHVAVPAMHGRLRVNTIGTGAFASRNIVSVVIPDSVTEIGAGAFAANDVLAIVLGAGVNIAASAFETSFTEFYARNRKAAGIYAHYGGAWHHLGASARGLVPVVRDGKISIVNYTGSARDVAVPARINALPVTEIGPDAFAGFGLRSVRLPEGLLRIGEGAFRDNGLSRLRIPRSVTEIGKGAFARNSIAVLELPPGLEAIADETFLDNMLARVVIPENVTRIGSGAFSVNRIISLSFSGNNLAAIDDGAFAVNRLREVEFPESLVLVGNRAFFDNRLASVSLPKKVAVIGEGAFAANRIERLSLPWGTVRIGADAFQENRLPAVTLPDSVAWIGPRAFAGNILEGLDIPPRVEFAGAGAFARNPPLARITITGENTVMEPGALDGWTAPKGGGPAGRGIWVYADGTWIPEEGQGEPAL